jgi:parallel beta-helix repeat protein
VTSRLKSAGGIRFAWARAVKRFDVTPSLPNLNYLFMEGTLNKKIRLSVGALVLVGIAGFLMVSPAHGQSYTPQQFGAKGNGSTDDTAALQRAVNAGDVSIPSATYIINRAVSVPSGRTIQCDSGAVLRNIGPGPHTIFSFNHTSNSDLKNCTLEGTNTGSPPSYDPGQEWDMGVKILNTSSHNGISGNTFRYFYGNSALTIYGPRAGASPSANDIEGNTFLNNAYFGASIVSGTNNIISNNNFINSSVGVEADDFSQILTANTITNNTIVNDGNGRPEGVVLRRGGQPSGFDYSNNQIVGNSVTGPATILWQGGMPDSGNTCTDGCQIR